MTAAVVLRSTTSVLRDKRDAGRALRITWHAPDDAFVLSTWRGQVCASTFQLPRSDVPDLIAALARGLADSAPPWSPTRYSQLPTGRLSTHVRQRFVNLVRRRRL